MIPIYRCELAATRDAEHTKSSPTRKLGRTRPNRGMDSIASRQSPYVRLAPISITTNPQKHAQTHHTTLDQIRKRNQPLSITPQPQQRKPTKVECIHVQRVSQRRNGQINQTRRRAYAHRRRGLFHPVPDVQLVIPRVAVSPRQRQANKRKKLSLSIRT